MDLEMPTTNNIEGALEQLNSY